ncbi:MAG: DUF3465 domain-containing protein [Desulforhopalus sp.]
MTSRKRSFIIAILAALLIVTYLFTSDYDHHSSSSSQVIEAFNNRKSNVQVSGGGEVIKILRDDLKGSKHQRIIVKINSEFTVLIAHNIDLAPRLDGVSPGDYLAFFGEYEWNKKGGVIHWTHHDPKKRHPDGWLKFKGRVYQ